MGLIYGLLLLFVAAPLLCRAAVDCSGVDGFMAPPEDTSSFVTHTYTTDVVGNDCESVTPDCFAQLKNSDLHQRTWYLTNTRPAEGVGYKGNYIQSYNIQCPPNTVLHLFPQFLDTEGVDNAGNCLDSVTVSVPGEFSEEFCGDDNARRQTTLYNDGLGMIFVGGNATVEFCTNMVADPSVDGSGYVVRAMCINPSFTQLPECADFNLAKTVDPGPDFIDRIFKPFEEPEHTNILHKRNAKLPGRKAHLLDRILNKRNKRFATLFVPLFELDDDDIVTYTDNMLVVDFNNGSFAGPFEVGWVTASSDLLGTRVFDVLFPSQLMTLQGPGSVEIRFDPKFNGPVATVKHTITEDMIPGLLIQSMEVLEAINRIADYSYINYIDPYPFVCPGVFLGGEEIFPLTNADVRDPRYRNIDDLGFIQEEKVNGTCERVVRINVAPGRDSRVEANIIDWCNYFFYSCNAMLRAACSDALIVDRLSGKRR